MVAEHARSLIFVDYGHLQSPGVLAKGFYFLTGFGHEAVMVFFVISGYLVGGKVWSLYREWRFGWRRYLADRASRLYAVLFVALLLGAAMDWTGYLFFNKYGLYNQGYEGSIAVLGAAPIERMGLRDFLVNAFFLQTIVGPTLGSNGPLWSLAYEWWYYVLFPLVLAAVWPIVDCGWRFFKGDRRTKIRDRGEEEILTTEDTTERLGGREMEQPKVGPKGEGVGTTESKSTEDGAGPCLDKPSGAAFSNPSTSELARDSENTSRTRSPSGAVLPATSYLLLVTRALSALGSLLAVAGLCWFLTWEILIFFGVWLLGVAASALQSRTDPAGLKIHDFTGRDSGGLIADSAGGAKALDSSSLLALDAGRWTLATRALSALFFGSALLLARAEVLEVPYGWQYLLGMAFALVLLSLAKGSRLWVFSKPSAYLADFSYSVYLIHFPVLMLVLSVAFSLTGYGIKIPFGVGGLIWFAVVFASAILFAWLVSMFTERNTHLVRVWFYSVLQIQLANK